MSEMLDEHSSVFYEMSDRDKMTLLVTALANERGLTVKQTAKQLICEERRYFFDVEGDIYRVVNPVEEDFAIDTAVDEDNGSSDAGDGDIGSGSDSGLLRCGFSERVEEETGKQRPRRRLV